LARRAELNVIRKQLLVCRVRAAFDDDIVRLQLEAGHVHEAVLDAAGEQDSEPHGGKGEYAANYRPADTQVQSRHNPVYRAIPREETTGDEQDGILPTMTSPAIAVAGFNPAPPENALRSGGLLR
jgi:hypothetical protein